MVIGFVVLIENNIFKDDMCFSSRRLKDWISNVKNAYLPAFQGQYWDL